VGSGPALHQRVRVIRVMLLDRSPIFVHGLAVRLGREPDLAVVASLSSVTEAAGRFEAGVPDVTVCGDAMAAALLDPEGVGVRRPRPPHVVVLAESDDVSLAADLFRVGAGAWVRRDQPCATLVDAIRSAHRGETWIPPDLLTVVLGELSARVRKERQADDRLAVLTDREREILWLYGQGLGRAEVAERLRLSPNTVRTHVQNILGRLGVHSTLAAVALARNAPSFDDAALEPTAVATGAAPAWSAIRQVKGRGDYRELRLAPDAR
jgi:DNA-binding NarL/FixJ family response regulator